MSTENDTRTTTSDGNSPVTVTVWSDPGCPWATLALETLRRLAGERVTVEHRAFPLELFNSRPTPREIVDEEIAAIADFLPSLGWRRWRNEDSAYPVSMLPPMEAVRAVASLQGPVAADELDAALRDAFYRRSECITITPTILEVADRCSTVDTELLADALRSGTHRGAVHEDWRTARSGAVRGSPHLFTPDGRSVHNPGAVWESHDAAGMRRPVLRDYDESWVEKFLSPSHHPRPATT
ncbi:MULTISPECIES: DsbA family protein [unclassified Actinopolyspora]|uniref:DsbA family oxidoreductase n=1 Tax=unclassified Actinopolyspora TaxID=2639451 RepID=UPI0013F5BAC4|nr:MULTISPECIES: DsbA family protein [unclassified Actinopolyspora]NHD16055.1 dithiol-disulfide isomerase [Actinopolyspora sp. BKK2]NHE74731.1 dithiol-disulfide isomerase [Actinopolyspora sp. BKK1]